MAEIAGATTASGGSILSFHPKIDLAAVHVEDITMLRIQYRCPRFRILVIGRANAGKTTILEKVCGVEKGTKPVVIHDKKGELNESPIHFFIFCSF